MVLPTSFKGRSQMTVEFSSCRRVLPPFLSYLLLVTAVFFVVVFGLTALFGEPIARVPLAFALGGASLAWRNYSWLRFVRFDHRSIRLRARRRGYAVAVAERNRGRVL